MVRTCVGLVLLATALGCGAIADDQVKDGRALVGWGAIVDPDGDCQIKGDKKKVTITVPGTPHDLSGNFINKNAPRVLQEIEGDFTVQVKVTGDFDPGNKPAVEGTIAFNGAGLLIWKNENNYLRLERNLWYTPDGIEAQFPPLLEYWKDNDPAFFMPGATKQFFEGRSTHLRLKRRGAKVTAFVSHDGKTWLDGKTLDTDFPKKVKVGIDAINTSSRPFTVHFEELRVTLGDSKRGKTE